MEQNNHKFRLRLNLFDAIILVAVLLVGAAAAWIGLRSGGETAPTAAPVRYTVLFQKMKEGESALIQPGDQLEDAVKNYQMGSVFSVEARPAEVQVLDQERQVYVNAVLEGYEDVYVTVESTCTTSGDGGALLLGGGYDFRVGQLAYVRGPGYMGSGPVTEIERGAEQ